MQRAAGPEPILQEGVAAFSGPPREKTDRNKICTVTQPEDPEQPGAL